MEIHEKNVEDMAKHLYEARAKGDNDMEKYWSDATKLAKIQWLETATIAITSIVSSMDCILNEQAKEVSVVGEGGVVEKKRMIDLNSYEG